MAVSWLDIWQLVLTGAVVLSTAVTIFILTLPKSYTHFHPGYITEAVFSQEDKENAERSGFELFKQRADDSRRCETKITVQIVVVGDIGRSPRMQYHALSLAHRGAAVQLIGYTETEVHPDVRASRFITVVPIRTFPQVLQTRSRLLFPVVAPLKALWQAWTLYDVLAYRTRASRFMMVQNPPSIPTLAVAVFLCFFRNTRLVVDWHNLGYTILALRLGISHPLVLISRWYEILLGRAAEAHFTVTHVMQRLLKDKFGVDAVTLHDRPANIFQPSTISERMTFLEQLQLSKPYLAELKSGARRLIVSSTSWTPDEDFNVLLHALTAYSADAASIRGLPRLLVVITGKGPLQTAFIERVRLLETSGQLENVKISTAWLKLDDYASLLAAADLGVCLHTSSSGVDLPMKVLDMFGAGIPVTGWNKYEAWSELVRDGENGLGFGSAAELQAILQRLFKTETSLLQKLKQGAIAEGANRWDDEWTRAASKTFRLER